LICPSMVLTLTPKRSISLEVVSLMVNDSFFCWMLVWINFLRSAISVVSFSIDCWETMAPSVDGALVSCPVAARISFFEVLSAILSLRVSC
jgi:hypothetical protein